MRDEQITRALAEKVMGWECVKLGPREEWRQWETCGEVTQRMAIRAGDDWNPLTDDRAACAVLDKMAADEWIIVLDKLPDTGWRCRFVRYRGGNEYAVEECRRLAICVAALKAVGAWEG